MDRTTFADQAVVLRERNNAPRLQLNESAMTGADPKVTVRRLSKAADRVIGQAFV